MDRPLKRDTLEPGRYDYLSENDSKEYDKVRDSTDPKDALIRRLLEDKAGASRSAHRNSRY